MALNSNNTFQAQFLFLVFGIIISVSFHIRYFFFIEFYFILTFISLIYCYYKFKQNKIGLLSLYVLVICFLPFINFFPNTLFQDLTNNPYILGEGTGAIKVYDKKILQLTSMISAACACGIAFSVSIFGKKKNQYDYSSYLISENNPKTLNLFFWFFWFLIGLFLYIGTMPPGGSIFNIQYHVRSRGFFDIFASAYLFSYLVIIFVIVDAFVDKKSFQRKIIKKFFCFFIFFYFFINLSTGTRETLPLIFGLFIFYFYWGRLYIKNIKFQKIPYKQIFLFSVFLIIFGSIIGYIRSEAFDKNYVELIEVTINKINLNLFLLGTWSSSLATTLSVSHDFIDNIKFKYGVDYLNLILSIPPGFIAEFLNYTRPISEYSGPAYEMRYGQGGTHITVLPFRNFAIIGVFLISAIWFSIIMYIEKFCSRKLTVIRLCILVSVVTIAPMFLWYGEKNAITGSIIFIILAIIYKNCLKINIK